MANKANIVRGGSNVGWEIVIDSEVTIEVNRTDISGMLTGQQRQDNAIISACASDLLQMRYDEIADGRRVALADLPGPGDDPDDPDGDPDKATDPNENGDSPTLFWCRAADSWGQGGNAVDIYRPINGVGGVGGTATHLQGRNNLLTVVYTGDIATATIRQESPPRSLR